MVPQFLCIMYVWYGSLDVSRGCWYGDGMVWYGVCGVVWWYGMVPYLFWLHLYCLHSHDFYYSLIVYNFFLPHSFWLHLYCLHSHDFYYSLKVYNIFLPHSFWLHLYCLHSHT